MSLLKKIDKIIDHKDLVKGLNRNQLAELGKARMVLGKKNISPKDREQAEKTVHQLMVQANMGTAPPKKVKAKFSSPQEGATAQIAETKKKRESAQINSNLNALKDKDIAMGLSIKAEEKAKTLAAQKEKDAGHPTKRAALKELMDHPDTTPEQREQLQSLHDKYFSDRILPGSNIRAREAQAAANRTESKDFKPGVRTADNATPYATAIKIKENKIKSDTAANLEEVQQQHNAGNFDTAHNMYNSIPKENLPQKLNGYNPLYMHYKISPDIYMNHINDDERQHLHEHHEDVLSGKHDNHEDPAVRGPALKVRSLTTNKPPAA
jgi:hypothetical protein